MSTTTIYSDAYIVIVDHPRGIQTAPWLDEVTYLIDANGQTTAVLEQTEKPTSGVSLEPVPFTPIQAAVIKSATITSSQSARAPTLAPSTTSSPSRPTSLSPTLTIALAIVGAILILIIIGATWYLLRRRNIRARAQKQNSKLRLEDDSRQSTPVEALPSPPRQLSLDAGEKATPTLMPRSILKPPKPPGTNGWLGTMQTMFGRADEGEIKKSFAENGDDFKKKGVTFGENQVREFGRTPLPSRTASLISRNTEE